MINIVHSMAHTAEVAVEKDVSHRALEFFPLKDHEPVPVFMYVFAAVKHAVRFGRLAHGQICTTHNLGWKQVQPDHDSRLSF